MFLTIPEIITQGNSVETTWHYCLWCFFIYFQKLFNFSWYIMDPSFNSNALKVKCPVFFFFLSTWHRLESFWKRKPQLKKFPTRWAHRQSCYVFPWLIIFVVGPSYIDATPPRRVVLGSIRKQAEEALRSKLVSRTPPWPLHQYL